MITNPLPSQITAIKGLQKDLPCTVQSDPAISVHWRWTKDGSPVDASRMKVRNDGSLRINIVQESDAGTYVCRVESVGGNATTSGTVRVQGACVFFNVSMAFFRLRITWGRRCIELQYGIVYRTY